MSARGLLLLSLALVSGCLRAPRFRAPVKLGGVVVPAATLNEGYEAYMQYCYACHGDKGDGRGPAASGMRPPPRDFTAGVFKFAGVPAGELPTDAELEAIVRDGLRGTPMLAWDISERERKAVVQYVKTFAPIWATATPGEPVVPDQPDPWRGREAEALAVGEKIYHLAGVELDPATNQPRAVLAGCNACHPSYLSGADLAALSARVLRRPVESRADPHRPELKESEYVVRDGQGATKVGFLPTDFLFHEVKRGTRPVDLFRTIAAGIGGTAMPTWKGQVKDEDLWALAHYVRHLIGLRDTPAGAALKAKLLATTPGRVP